jgi:hypothetical protein
MWFYVASALAAEPQVAVQSDGTVVCTVTLAASESQVRAALVDGAGSSRLSPDVLAVESAKKGACEELTKETRGLFHNFRLRSLRCPTADGWSEKLVSSDDFTEFQADWSIATDPAGTRVTYTVKTGLSIPVPDSLLRQSLAKATATMLGNLAQRVIPGGR